MMDPSHEHVLHQHADLDPHLGVLALPSVHGHHVLSQQVPIGGYMHSAHSLPMPQPQVHMVPNPVSQVPLTGSPYVHPGLMQEQTEKYGPLLFHKDDQGLYTCFFTGCGKKLKANFSRHVAKHEMDGDKMDPNLATQIQTSSASKNLGTTKICSHPTHQEWWGTSAEQPVTEFYKRCSKCKKCYIRLQQESKRQRLSLEGHSPMGAPVMLQPQYASDMFPMGHVNTLPMLDHHLKRDDLDDDQGPTKRMRIEESASLMASLQELTYKHFKEMAELTARHSAQSRKLIADNSAVRMAAELRHSKDKEDLEAKFRNQWDQFRLKCLREREDLYQAQLVALNRELNGATIPVRPCRLCTKRIYSTFLYQCNLCNQEACIRCQAVMVCGVCGTKSCENCTIKHNWLIWCNRCHKTFCSNHRSLSDEICPGCDGAQKGLDLMMHPQHLSHSSHLHHDLDHPSHLHHSHSDYDHDHLQMHHHSNHHHQEELMGQHLKFEDLDHDSHHPHSHHSHELNSQHLHMDPHMHHDHLQHDHMQHISHDHLQHDHLQHEHMQHHLQHDHNDHHHYQDQQYELPHITSDLSEHHHHQQQYEQNYHSEQQEYQESIHDQQGEQEEQSQNYQEQNYQEQQNGQGGSPPASQDEEQQERATEQEQAGGQTNEGEESQQYLQEQGEQEQSLSNEQDQSPSESQEQKYEDLEPSPQQPVQ